MKNRTRLVTPSFYQQDTESVARSLLGKRLVHCYNGQRLSGIINETEAYLGFKDKACHTYSGKRTPRTETMFLSGGHAYVYLIYGMYHCLNVVTEAAGEAILIRSLVVDEGESIVRANRPKVRHHKQLANGPGKLCMALQIDRSFDGINLMQNDRLWIEQGQPVDEMTIQARPRIGIVYAREWADKPLRFVY